MFLRAGERAPLEESTAGSGREWWASRSAPSGNVAVGKLMGQVPVSPSGECGIMDVDDELEDGDEGGDGEVLQLDEPVERRGAEMDGRAVQKLVDPRRPSLAEVELHNLTHIPYRNWCSVCVRCRGKDLDHRRAVDDERGVSEYAFDYCFPGDELGFKLLVVLTRE